MVSMQFERKDREGTRSCLLRSQKFHEGGVCVVAGGWKAGGPEKSRCFSAPQGKEEKKRRVGATP